MNFDFVLCQAEHDRLQFRSCILLLMLLIRSAAIDDVPLLRTMIRELAEFEHELDHCVIEEGDLARDGFGVDPKFRALIAEWNGSPAGYAVFFGYYSTWVGSTLYLEDLFVRPQFRGNGIGTSMLAEVARIAVSERCVAVRWEVLAWNDNAIGLYKALGAQFLDQWKPVLLTDEALHRLAQKSLAQKSPSEKSLPEKRLAQKGLAEKTALGRKS
jgi:ribosomal protein S18 acetylase RimI-like enzyme